MKTLLSFLFALLVFNANAKNYYFSSTSGDDSRTASQAINSSTPWKSIGKLNSSFSILMPGDSILFKRGDVFYGAITVTKSGSSSSPIVFSAYGSGNKPMITSLVTLSNWASVGNGIYETYNSSLGSNIGILLFNGKQQEMGRYPNSETDNNGYLMFESHVGTTSITDKELTSGINWTGAELVLRTRRWIIDRNFIKSHSGTTITYTPTSSAYAPYDDHGYFIQNSIKTLDRLGEWYYNSSTKKASVYFGSGTPSNYKIQAAALSDLISVTSYNYLVFDNLEIEGTNGSGIKIKNGTNITIKNCDISFSGQDGINATSHDYLKVENSTINNSNENGINLNYTGDFATIRNNKISNTALFLGFNSNGDGKGVGIKSYGNGNTIEYNEVINTGYIGINFNGNNVTIKNNFIDRFCIAKDDGGGIYTWQGDAPDYKNRKIIGNVVLNGIGAGYGTDNPTYYPVEGIYFDNGASYVECRDNTIANCGNNGVYLHNAHDLILKNNTFYNCNRQFTAVQKENNIPVRNNTIMNNIFFSKQEKQLTSYLKSNANDIKDFGKMDSNYYARPLDDRLTIYNSYPKSSTTTITQNFHLETWKDKYNKDHASKRSAKQIAPFKLNRLLTPTKLDNGLFATSITGAQKSGCSATWSNDGKMEGGYITVSPTSRSSTVYFNIGSVTAGKKYILRYTVKGSVDSTSIIGAILRQALSPYTNLTSSQDRPIGLTKTNNEILFISPTTESNATVVFKVDDQVPYYLDNISVYEADAIITNIDDSLRFEYNSGKTAKTISLGTSYVDVKNNKYNGTVTLQPYSSVVLIRDGSAATSPANEAPVVAITSPLSGADFTSPATVSIAATATDADGTVSKVDFYNGSTLLGSDNSSPFTYSWSGVAAGTYSITAKATDNDGSVATSSSVEVNITSQANEAPVVAITSPASGAGFTSPAAVSIAATATDADGTVSKVDFYNGTTLLGSDNSSPYTYSWSGVAAGTYTITAKATDNDGSVTTSSSVKVNVTSPANEAPVVAITSPVSGAGFTSPATVSIAATATDADGTVSKVDFYNGSTLLGSENNSPYTYSWSGVAAGTYIITAKATDNDGSVTTSAPVEINVTSPANEAPVVALISPLSGAGFTSPATVNIAATATDADGTVSKVDFYNGSTLLGSENISPYTYSWSGVAAGTYTITAKATDNDGSVTTSAPVEINVTSPVNEAPVVAITSPVSGAGFTSPATVSIAATATDADGSVSKVDFYNGSTLLGSDNSSPYSYSWSGVAAGTFTITAKATDNDGSVTTSAPVEVNLTSVVNVAPLVNITSPVNNATFGATASISMSANASDIDGRIIKVQFYRGSTLIQTEDNAPYLFTWRNVAAGVYTITAVATDDKGLTTTSSPILLVVGEKANVAPTVKITSPGTSAASTSQTYIRLTADALDTDGTITKVQFYNGTSLIKTENIAPYDFTWDNVSAGTYKITAKAFDNDGAITASSSVTITVNEPASLTKSITLASQDVNYVTKTETPGISVSPNPAFSSINVSTKMFKSNQAITVSILSSAGNIVQTLKSNAGTQSVTMNVSSLVNGSYFVQAVSGKYKVSQQFIKQ